MYTGNAVGLHLLLDVLSEDVRCVGGGEVIFGQGQMLRADIPDFSAKDENIDQRVCEISVFMLLQPQPPIIYIYRPWVIERRLIGRQLVGEAFTDVAQRIWNRRARCWSATRI